MADYTMIQERFWRNGPKPGAIYDLSAVYTDTFDAFGGKKKTLNPMTTGTSILGMKFNGGVVIAADKQGSYGSLSRYRNINRVVKINDSTVLSGSGDIADFQSLQTTIEEKVIEEECREDAFTYTPKSLFSWLTRVLYNRRTKMDPLWVTLVVAGIQDGAPFLGYVDKLGMAYEAPTIATGFGMHIAQPIMREVVDKSQSLSKEQAIQTITRCMTVLSYRDSRALNKYDLAVITRDGVEISGPIQSETNWEIAHMI